MAIPRFPLQPIGQCYLFEVAHRNGSYIVESGHLPRGRDLTRADALAGAYQHDDLVAVWEGSEENSELRFRNISEDIARAMLAESDAADEYDLSDFIRDNLSETEIADHFADLEAWGDRDREIASPYLTGRI